MGLKQVVLHAERFVAPFAVFQHVIEEFPAPAFNKGLLE